MFYCISGVHFGIKSAAENKALCVGEKSQFSLKHNPENGKLHLEYNNEKLFLSKPCRYREELYKKFQPKVLYENTGHPAHYLVRLYQKYLSLRPTKDCPKDFYLRPLGNPKANPMLFRTTPIGKHSLSDTVSRLMKSAGYVGCYTSQSIQSVCPTSGNYKHAQVVRDAPRFRSDDTTRSTSSPSNYGNVCSYEFSHTPRDTPSPSDEQFFQTIQYYEALPMDNVSGAPAVPSIGNNMEPVAFESGNQTGQLEVILPHSATDQETSSADREMELHLLDDELKEDQEDDCKTPDSVCSSTSSER